MWGSGIEELGVDGEEGGILLRVKRVQISELFYNCFDQKEV